MSVDDSIPQLHDFGSWRKKMFVRRTKKLERKSIRVIIFSSRESVSRHHDFTTLKIEERRY